eukprot:3366776-Alexandrium_andersonii.AAC.1
MNFAVCSNIPVDARTSGQGPLKCKRYPALLLPTRPPCAGRSGCLNGRCLIGIPCKDVASQR